LQLEKELAMSRSLFRRSSIEFSRRDLLRLSWAGLVGGATLPWLEAMADPAAAPSAARKRACILLWMNGGPSQMDTFDLKPGHENGGSFKEIATSVPGIKISEHLPKIAALAASMAIIRSMSTKEGDHGRATYLLRNGYLPQPPVRYPTLGSLVAKELEYFKARGGRSVVDATSVGIKRNPLGLARIAKTTGLNIIMGAGYYLAPTHPKDMSERTGESLAEEAERDVLEGADGTGVKAGVIGEIGCSWPWHDNERKALRAAAIAARNTGAPLMVHVGRNEAAPFEIVTELEKARIDLSHTILCHIDRTIFDKQKLVELAKTGVYLEFDLFGHEVSGYPFTPDKFMPNDGDRVERVKRLLDKGFVRQVLLAQDICYKHRLVKYGGHGYAHILENVAPRMKNAGVSQSELDTMLIENPARVLAFR